ncbi:MAG: proline--tRNA ligase, partial [Clostridia bacterium]|nr:proline--tRNA ligase [Clostridia bacterium]
RNEMTHDAKNLDEMKTLAAKGGFIRAMWCGDRACEEKIKEDVDVSSRCIPFEQETISETCVCCGKKATKMVYWGKAY